MNKVSAKISEYGLSLRNSYHKLKQPFCKTSIGQNVLSFIDPALWHKIPDEIKRTTNLNTFKHNLKKHYLKETGKSSFLKLVSAIFYKIFIFSSNGRPSKQALKKYYFYYDYDYDYYNH